jgi:protein TonB
MKLGLLGIFCAVLLHAGVLLFGGLLFGTGKKDAGSLQAVELLSADELETKKDEPKEEEPPPEREEEMQTETEEVPDASEVIRSLEFTPVAEPALDAASLSAIELALGGQHGGGDFAAAVDFSSGGRIGGVGKAGEVDSALESAFSLTEIDQKPRALFQAAPLYPAEMRNKRIEGVVTVIFVVDASGKVIQPRVEKSSHPAFERPALDAVKQWKFEPGLKGGQRVGCKMRVPIRFQPS